MLIKRLSGQTRAGKICDIFSRYGKVIDIYMPLRQELSREFAFVKYLHVEEMRRVIWQRDELDVNDTKVFVVAVKRHNGSLQVAPTKWILGFT